MSNFFVNSFYGREKLSTLILRGGISVPLLLILLPLVSFVSYIIPAIKVETTVPFVIFYAKISPYLWIIYLIWFHVSLWRCTKNSSSKIWIYIIRSYIILLTLYYLLKILRVFVA